MACRIHNLGKHRLALDLRGGQVIYIEPNQISPPLREELLYENVHLPQWLKQGLVKKIDAKMAEVVEYESGEAKAGTKQPRRRAQDKDKPDETAVKDDKAAAETADKSAEKKPRSKPGKEDGPEDKPAA